MARQPADGNEPENVNVGGVTLPAEIEALKHRPAALDASLSQNRIARRRALGLGVLASLLAFIGHSAARATDALTIDANGNAYFNGKRNYFKDEENKGWLRVGALYSVPGIFSQDQAVVVGAEGRTFGLPAMPGPTNLSARAQYRRAPY
jgi:hypothetical protein